MNIKSSKYKKKRLKFSIFSLAIYFLGVLIFSYWNYQNDKNKLLNEVDKRLLSVATNIKNILPASFFEISNKQGVLSSSLDWKNIKILTQFANSFNIAFIYTMVKKDTKVYFTSCSTNLDEIKKNNFVTYWTYYDEASEIMIKAFESDYPLYETTTDKWGEFRSVFVPYKKINGEIVLLCADYDYSKVNNTIYSSTKTTILKGFFFIFLAFPMFFSVYYLQRKSSKYLEMKINERMQELTDEIVERKSVEAELKKSYTQLEDLAIKANAASQAKSSFLATMSHEIRTPMNGIIGMINILKQSELTIEQKDSLSIIDFSANNLLAIVNDILDFSKIESGQIELENIPLDLYKGIDDIIKLLSFKTTDNNIALKREIESDVPRFIIGDPVRINQIVLNLTNNALKFTENGSVSIKIEKLDAFEDYITLRIYVIDTGIGISKDGMDKLFKEFSQANSQITRKYGGTGLGLAISKRLAEQMGGEIGVESKLGIGSSFWFTIKVKICTNEIYLNSKHQPIIKKMEHKLEILVAEDNVINQKIVTANLKKMGHKVDVAQNGKIAVDMFKLKNYDIILMDVQMPEMNGIEATQLIRIIEENENRNPIFIAAMTANVLKEDIEHYLKIGMNTYLSKPFKVDELVNLLNKIQK
jgi:signal transduction histidine kinase/CheY-like chemotaxis protein